MLSGHQLSLHGLLSFSLGTEIPQTPDDSWTPVDSWKSDLALLSLAVRSMIICVCKMLQQERAEQPKDRLQEYERNKKVIYSWELPAPMHPQSLI